MGPTGPPDTPFGTAGFFYDARHDQILLHFRSPDAQTNPSKWAFFGGSAEDGESPAECFCREIKEELGIRLEPHDLRHLRSYFNARSGRHRHAYVVERFISPAEIVLGEGVGFAWIPLSKVFEYDLTDSTRRDIDYFLSVHDDRPRHTGMRPVS